MPTANMMVIVALLFASIGALAGAKRISQPPFNVQEHLIYMNYTWAAYCDPSALSSWTCDYCTDVSVKYAAIFPALIFLHSTFHF